ncbi:MAG: GNAT family N-acetyltransferase [Mariprofundaceae bacterium]
MSACPADALQPIRRGNLGDIADAHALNERLLPEAWSFKALADAIDMGSELRVWRTATGKLAAYYLGQNLADETHMLQLVVDRPFQRQGLALALCRAVIDDKRQSGSKRIFLEMRESNRAALGLYAQLGFHISGRRPGYYAAQHGLPREDALLLTMHL